MFSSEFCQLFKNTYFVEDLWRAGYETPACLFKNTPSFREHLQWLVLAFLAFQPATLLKKFEFCKIFKSIFWQDTSGWLLLVFICEFSDVVQITSFIEYLWETYFKYKLLDFNHQIQEQGISQVLFKHVIQEQKGAIQRLEAATRNVP